jgi:hypothetical protein
MQPLNPAAHNVLGLASGEPLLLEQQGRMTAVYCGVPTWAFSIGPQTLQGAPACPPVQRRGGTVHRRLHHTSWRCAWHW